MKSKNTYNAIYYERVSTTHDSQDESLENQRKLCESYLKRHPEITLVEQIDSYSERISGKSDSRPRFQAMLERIKKGDIDYILVKDFKRISRSVEVSSNLKTLAKKFGFKFILLSTGQIYDINAEESRMLYGFESLLNEEVVFRQSSYSRIAYKQKYEQKKLDRNNITFGYTWDFEKQDIIIDERQAEIIRTIYDLYVFQNLGILEIRRWLATKGCTVSKNTISNWLQETAYIGIFHLNKKSSELGVGAGQKTKYFINPHEEWIPVERPELAIVDEDIFNLAQRVRESRKRFYAPDKNGIIQDRFRGTHLFSSKIFCGECGNSYLHGYSDRKQTISIYRDSYNIKTKKPLLPCENEIYKRVYEEDMKIITVNVVNNLITKNKDCFTVLIQAIESVFRDESSYKEKIAKKQTELHRLSKNAQNILEKFEYATGELLSALNDKYNAIKAQLHKVEVELEELQNQVIDENQIKAQLRQIEESISKWKFLDIDTLDRHTIESFIYKMVIHKDGKLEVLLNSEQAQSSISNINEKTKDNLSVASTPVSTECNLDKATYVETAKNSINILQEKHTDYNYISLMSFNYQEKIGNRKTKKKLDFQVIVNILVA